MTTSSTDFMNNLPADWAEVPLIETSDRVKGGVDGSVNQPSIALTKRTNKLKELVGRTVLVFDDYESASNAAATLPDGQVVEIESDETNGGGRFRYIVEGGAIADGFSIDTKLSPLTYESYADILSAAPRLAVGQVVDSLYDQMRYDIGSGGLPINERQIVPENDYSKIQAYTGRATRLKVIDNTGAHWWIRRGAAASNGGTVLVDASGRRWEREYSGSVNVRWFGAGSGPNDTAAINAAINALPAGQKLIGLGATYLVTGTLALKANMTLEDFVFNFSTAPNSGELLTASGSLGAEINVSSALTPGQVTFTVADGSGFAAGDYVYIKSSDFWDDWDDVVIMAEVHRIKSVSGNSITLHDPILYDMPTSPKVQKITTLDNLTLRNVRAFGSGAGALGDQEGARFAYCKNLLLDNCNFKRFDDRGVRLTTCINFSVANGEYGEAYKTGTSYGISLAGACINGKFYGVSFADCRHGISLGGGTGPNRYIVVDGNTFSQCREAGMDAHTAADLCIVSSNTFQCDPNSALSDGILWRGTNVTITDNMVIDAGRYGINVINNVTGANSSYTIKGNTLLRSRQRGVSVAKQHGGNIKNLIVSDNIIQNANAALDYGILLTTQNGYTNEVENVVVTGNTISDIAYRAIVVSVGSAASTCRGVVVSDNAIRSALFDRGVFISATTDGNISGICVTGNVITGSCTQGIRGTNEEDIVVTGNTIKTATGGAVVLSATNFVNANNLT